MRNDASLGHRTDGGWVESFPGEAEMRAQLPAKYHHLFDPEWKPGRGVSDEEIALHKSISDQRDLATEAQQLAERRKQLKAETDRAQRTRSNAVHALMRADWEETGRAAMAIGLDLSRIKELGTVGAVGDELVAIVALGQEARSRGFTEAILQEIAASDIPAEQIAALVRTLRARNIDPKQLLNAAQHPAPQRTGAGRRPGEERTQA